jgi:hypothetical protein
LIKNCKKASIQDVQATGKRSVIRTELPALQKMFSFLPFWIRIRIANPDADPGAPLNPDPDMDPDPQLCFFLVHPGSGSGVKNRVSELWHEMFILYQDFLLPGSGFMGK